MPQTKKKQQPFVFTPYPGTENTQPQEQPPVRPLTSNDIQNNLNNHINETLSPITQPIKSTAQFIGSSILSPALDVISRGQYASAKFFDSMTDNSKSLVDALGDSLNEAVYAKEKLSYADVIKKKRIARGENVDTPRADAIVGFLGDVFLDPLTYLGIGNVKNGIVVGGKVLNKIGLETLVKGLEELGTATRFISKDVDVLKVLHNEAMRSGKGATEYSFESKKILSDAGYFDHVAQKADEIYNFAKEAGAEIPKHQAAILAREEVYKDLATQARKPTGNVFGLDEIRETVEERISRIADLSTNEGLKLFEPSGVRLKVGLPFGKQYDIPGSREALKAIGLDYTQRKLTQLGKVIGDKVGPANLIGRTFFKEFDPLKRVSDEFWDSLHSIENTFDSVSLNVQDTTRQMFKGIPQERRTVIGQTMSDVRDATYLKEKELGRSLTQQEANDIKSVAFSSAKLDPKEFSLVSQLYQDYAKMAELEKRSDLLGYTVTNYTPRKWQMLEDPTDIPDLLRSVRQNGKLNVGMSSSKATKYATVAEGIADGMVPELDAAVLYANRLINSREKLSVANFNQSTRYIYGFDPSPKPLAANELAQLPKVVQSNIKMLGDAVYPAGMNDEFGSWLKGFDRLQSWFKRGAYAIKPNAAPRQALSNTFQAAMIQGVKAFKAFDPRAAGDAALLFLDRGKPTKNLPEVITNFFNKHAKDGNDAILASRLSLERITGAERLADYSNNFKLKSALGQEYDGNYLVDWMQQNGVIKGFDAAGENMKVKIERALRTNTDTISGVAGELSKFWKWPALTEDYSRAMLFMNGLRMGYSEKQALGMVNKALFDYSRGLSYMEKNVFKRIIPFYTYQRFAVPYVFKNVAKRPGEALTGEKLMHLMEKLIISSNDTLTPSEQESVPGYLMEQPRLYRGFDKDNNAKFNIFNNMTPLDAMSILQYDKQGNLDFPRTMERTVLAQMTPFIKIPLEESSAIMKNFFTQQTLDKAGKLGDINSSTLSAVIPNEFKELMGWENRVDQRTGKQTVYINPYYAHRAMGFVPGLASYVALFDKEKSPLETAMDFIVGVKTDKFDLKEQAQFKVLNQDKELRTIYGRIRSAKQRGATSQFEKAKKDYEDLINTIKENRINVQDARGQGLRPADIPQDQLPQVQPLPDTQQ